MNLRVILSMRTKPHKTNYFKINLLLIQALKNVRDGIPRMLRRRRVNPSSITNF